MEIITAYFDGSCEQNPGGRMGYGAMVNHVPLWSGSESHPNNTNNVAEHRALNLIFDYLDRNNITDCTIEIIGDSQMSIRQMTGEYRIKPSGKYYTDAKNNLAARDFLEKHNNINFIFTWVPREDNTVCDGLSNLYYTEGNKSFVPKQKKEIIFLPCVEPKYKPKERRKSNGKIAQWHKGRGG